MAGLERTPLMVAPVSKAWVRTDNDPRPLLARWEDAGAELAKLGGQIIAPASEPAILEMRETARRIERERRAAAEPVRNEMLVSAGKEFSSAVDRYRMAYVDTIERQEKLRRSANDPILSLLFNMNEILRPPVSTQDLLDAHFDNGRPTSEDLYRIRQPTFGSVADCRQATNLVSDFARELEDRLSTIVEVTRFPNDDVGEQLRRITLGLLRRLNTQTQAMAALSGRLDEIAGQIERVAATARYVRKHRKGSK
jgi:hypothetical protein